MRAHRRECRCGLPGYTISRGSPNAAIGEHELQLAKHQIPILVSGMPMLHDALRGQIEHPAQRIIVGERRLVLGDLPELAVQTFDNVRRV